MAIDPDLQALIDARKAADRAKMDAAEAKVTESRRMQEAEQLRKDEWSTFAAILNDEAGRINSIKSDTQIEIQGAVDPKRDASRPYALYKFFNHKATARMEVFFEQDLDGEIKHNVSINNTKNIEILNAELSSGKIKPTSQTVRQIFSEMAKLLMRA